LLGIEAKFSDFELALASSPSAVLKPDTRTLAHHSTGDLQSFLLGEFSEAANLRAELERFLAQPLLARDVRRARKAKYGSLSAYRYSLFDCLVDRLCTVRLAQWLLNGGLEEIRQAILHGPSTSQATLDEVRAQIRDYGRSPEERAALAEWRQRVKENPGEAHRSAVLNYGLRNIAAGKCERCPHPLDRNSVRYCTKHLEVARLRKPPKGGHGCQPGSLKVLALQREKQMRTTPEERALWDRVAKQLGMSPVHVRNVATGVKHSDKVAAALLAEASGTRGEK
jgi:hypothetical protein